MSIYTTELLYLIGTQSKNITQGYTGAEILLFQEKHGLKFFSCCKYTRSRKTTETAQECRRTMTNIKETQRKQVIDGAPASSGRYAGTDLRDSAKMRSWAVHSRLDGDTGKVMVLFCCKVET